MVANEVCFSDSLLLDHLSLFNTSLAAIFCTLCSLWMFLFGMPTNIAFA